MYRFTARARLCKRLNPTIQSHRFLSSATPEPRNDGGLKDLSHLKEKDRKFFMEHGMTRQQAHQARAIAAKEERARRRKRHIELQQTAHEKRIETAQHFDNLDQKTRQEKDQRIVKTNRVLAAKAIPFWLGRDSKAFDDTMAALNLKNRTSITGTKKSQDGLRSEYRQVYLDSLPSFLDKVSAEDRSEELSIALDKLADTGFSDLHWAKNFRSAAKYQNLQEHFSSRIQGKRDRLIVREKTLVTLQQELVGLQKRADDYIGSVVDNGDTNVDNHVPPKEGRDKGYFAMIVGAVSDFLSVEQTPNIPSDVQSFDQQILTLQDSIAKTIESIDATKQQLEVLFHKQNEITTTPEDEFKRATKCIEEVLPVITQALAIHINERHASMIEQYQTLDAKTDLTKPHEWYLHARMDRRKIIFHGGPTNSGKTYNALKRLKEAKQGLYLGPLRLLAAEVYETLTSAGIYTSLFTGQERREVPFSTHASATVEMAPTDRDYDVVVIDEIQMVADTFRGYAWTRALLGLRCKEIHVCGGMEAESIVRKIAKSCGDEFEIHQYERFSSLTVATTSIADSSSAKGSYRNVQPGDCVVAFSKNDIFAIKREIEDETGHKCCVIYGSLPPETRTEQARRFNNPDSEYDVLIASDAIGMGLNLNIRRIIFNSIYKSDGESIVRLDHSAIKQIAGRAGRRNSPFPNGEVTCRDPQDLPYIQRMLSSEIAPIAKAGLLPTAPHIAMFSAALEKYGLSKDFDKLDKILVQFSDMATVKGDFFLCRQTPMNVIARYLRDLQIPIEDKYTLTMSPVQPHNQESMAVLRKFALKYASGQASGLTLRMFPKPAKTFDDLGHLCCIHSELELFLWLHNRFPANANFVEQQTAMAMKEQTIKFINDGLFDSENLKIDHCYITRDKRLRATFKQIEKDQGIEVDDIFQEGSSNAELSDI